MDWLSLNSDAFKKSFPDHELSAPVAPKAEKKGDSAKDKREFTPEEKAANQERRKQKNQERKQNMEKKKFDKPNAEVVNEDL